MRISSFLSTVVSVSVVFGFVSESHGDPHAATASSTVSPSATAGGANALASDQDTARAIKKIVEKMELARDKGTAVDMRLLVSQMPIGRVCSNGKKAVAVVYSPLPESNPPRFALFEHRKTSPFHYKNFTEKLLAADALQNKYYQLEAQRANLAWRESTHAAIHLLLSGKSDSDVLAELKKLERHQGAGPGAFEMVLDSAKKFIKDGRLTVKTMAENSGQLAAVGKELEELKKTIDKEMTNQESLREKAAKLFQEDAEKTFSLEETLRNGQKMPVTTPNVPLFTYTPQENERDEEQATLFRKTVVKKDGSVADLSNEEVKFIEFPGSILVNDKQEPYIETVMIWKHDGEEWDCY
jgi:hypothetical protein